MVVTFAKRTRLPGFLGPRVTTIWSCPLTSIPLTGRFSQLFYLGLHAVQLLIEFFALVMLVSTMLSWRNIKPPKSHGCFGSILQLYHIGL